MIRDTSFFQSKWYHFGMAAIYFIAGVLLIVKSYTGDQYIKAGIVGLILCVYSIYRVVSRIQVWKKVKDENNRP